MKKILIISCLVIVAAIFIASPLLIKVRINCKSQYGACPQQILDKLNLINGKSLFSAKSNIKKILKSEFLISDYSVQFKIPNILQTDLLVKKAAVAFRNQGNNIIILVDNEGKVLSNSQDSALPIVNTDEKLPEIGQNISETNHFALKLASGIFQMYQIRESKIEEGGLLVELPGPFKVIFPLDGDSDILLGSLRLIYSKVKEDGNLAGYSQIDLRFKNPVLR